MARSLAKNGAFSTLYVMYGSAAAFVATLIVSHGAGAAGAGSFFQVMALFTIGTSLCVFGADTGLVRTISAQRAVGRYSALPRIIRFAVGPATIIALVVVISALIYALPAITPGLNQDVRLAIFASAPFLVVATWMTLAFGALRGLGQTIEFTFLQSALLPTLRILAVLLAVSFSGAVVYLALAWSLPIVLVLLLAVLWVRKFMPTELDAPEYTTQFSYWQVAVVPAVAAPESARSFWLFSSARGVSAMVEAILEWIDVLLVGLFLGPVASGIYGAVNRCVRVGAMVEHTARVVTGPEISAAIARVDMIRARQIFVSATRILIAVGWPFFITLALFGETLLRFFGQEFTAGAPLFWIICSAMLLQMAAGGVQSVLLMSGKSRWQLYNKLSALAVAATLNLTLIPLWGLAGAATAWAAAVLTDSGLATWQVYTQVGIRPKPAEVLPIIALAALLPGLGAVAAIVLLGQTLTALLIYLLIVLPLYLVLLYRFRASVGLEKLFNPITRKLRR
ncbi:MAG: polysaccharide biosynthesis C-terminal domain-containing protein [Rothia sp. (in: high G+C Gram-positive bacteria)]|nr:polysaccharide biosynthesis C-terminal domain-containing protein [Rothia sp. (in: high G+C Gram-positive bacteria)]